MDTNTLKAAAEATDHWRNLQDQLKQAKSDRDAAIQAAAEDGYDQKDIVDGTGLTRETIRRITNPDAAAAVLKAAADRRAAKKKEV